MKVQNCQAISRHCGDIYRGEVHLFGKWLFITVMYQQLQEGCFPGVRGMILGKDCREWGLLVGKNGELL